MKKTTTNNVNRLIEFAYEINEYCQAIPYGAQQQKRQARALIEEVERTLKQENEWTILNLFETSITPKLMRLAKDINMYTTLLGKAPKNRLLQKEQREIAYSQNCTPFAPIKKTQQPAPLNAEEAHTVRELLDNIKKSLPEQ